MEPLPGPKRGVPEAVTARLDRMVRRLGARRRVEHAVVAVERGDGSRWVGAAGRADMTGAPMQADTPFFIASVTKLFIATTILKLREDGRLRLDDPISTHLPATLVEGLHRLDGVDRSDQLTVLHLLGHTSGLPDYLEERPGGGRSLVERLTDEGDFGWEIEDALEIVRDGLTPHFPPQPIDAARRRARYSDTNYLLLIAIIEAITGRSQGEVFEEVLFAPLGLRHTWVAGRSSEPRPAPATLWFKDQPFDRPLAMRSFRDLYSTADDLLTFLRSLVQRKVFDDPSSLDLMRQEWIRFGFPRDRASLRAPGWPIEYALGTMRFRFTFPRIKTPRGGQPRLIGHTGSTGSWLFHCPELDLLLAGTVDQATAGALPFRFVPRLLRVASTSSR